MFSTQLDDVSLFVHIFDIISLFAVKLEDPKFSISGKGLITTITTQLLVDFEMYILVFSRFHFYSLIEQITQNREKIFMKELYMLEAAKLFWGVCWNQPVFVCVRLSAQMCLCIIYMCLCIYVPVFLQNTSNFESQISTVLLLLYRKFVDTLERSSDLRPLQQWSG